MNKYEKILARPDKKRPHYFDELPGFFKFPKGNKVMVMDIKLLTPGGGEIRLSWSKKDADEMTKAGR